MLRKLLELLEHIEKSWLIETSIETLSHHWMMLDLGFLESILLSTNLYGHFIQIYGVNHIVMSYGDALNALRALRALRSYLEVIIDIRLEAYGKYYI